MTIQAKALVRLTGIILTLFLFTTIAAKAQAGAGDSGSTEININNDGPVVIDKAGDYTITGTGQTGNTITVELESKDAIANITIKGVDILKAGISECPFNIIQGTVHLTLVGDGNVLKAGDYCAALQVAENSVLVITGEETGKLKAIGGYDGAGIGGGSNSPAGSITIAGGNVYATGGVEAAGIGGGMGSTCDFINIAGGNVVAEGGASGAGIGGGMGGLVGSITISGGTVEATGGERAAGIGGGFSSSGGTITISGGKVTTGGNIGDGLAGYHASGEIKGGTIVCKSFTSTLTISGGSVRTDDNSVIKGMAVVKVPHANAKVTSINIGGDSSYGSKDVYTDGEGKLYLYIPQDKSDPVTLTIEGIDNPLPASREYDITNGSVTIKAAGDYAIVGGETQTGNTITVNLGKKEDVANITIEGVKIGLIGCPFDIKQGVVNLTLEGDNVLKAQRTYSDDTEIRCAALQVSENSELVITEKSTGKLTATGGYFAAGIGGGASNAFGSIIINGGTLDATGGDSGAGIGGGADCTFGSITIKGGTVNATGGEFGASIGGGMDGSDVFIDISGGKITTKGNIGDGEGGSRATGEISGGTIVCTSISSALSITGGSVRTKDNSVDKNGKVMAVVKGLPNETEVKSIKIDGKEYGSTDVSTDKDGKLYLYIPQGKPASVSLTIDKTKYDFYVLTSLVVEKKDNVGGYTQTPTRLTITKAGEYTLKGLFALIPDKEKEGKKVSEYAIDYSIVVADNIQGKVTLHLDGVSLKSEAQYVPALSCGSGNTITVVLDGDNYLEGGNNVAGINKGNDDGTLTIEGPGRLEAKGGLYGAGIGGNSGQQANNITIAGGTIVATGGDVANADIGCGYMVSGASNISITGGSVNATVEGITDQTKTEVTFPAKPGDKVIQVQGLDDYKLLGMNLYPEGTPSKATLYLWLPSGFNKEITINGYSATVKAGVSATLEAITIDGPESYDKSVHKNKSIKITSKGTFTINTLDASVIDLTIKKGGKLLTNKELKVEGRFTVEANTNEQKWLTFCSPVPLKLLNQSWATGLNSSDLFLKSGFTTANDQKWTFEQSIKEDTPYLIGVPIAVTACTLYAQDVTLPKEKKIEIKTPSGFDNNLLFCANKSLTEQELTNIYVLEDHGDKQAILLKDNYTLKPFEAYFIASPASSTSLAIESQGEPGKVTSPELRAAPNDIIMPQKLTLKQPDSGKGSFTVKKEGQVAYGFALRGETVTLELSPNKEAGYSTKMSLIEINIPDGTNIEKTLVDDNTCTFTMPADPVTIKVEFMKTLTINPDEGQVVYEDENDYHPTYTVKGITEADGNVVFTGNLKVGDGNKIVNDNLSAGDKYKIDVKGDVIVTQLSGNAADAVAALTESAMGENGWHKSPTTSVTLVAPRGFSIKQTSATPSPASLSLRDAAADDGYVNELTFTDQGEHTVYYSLKRDGMDKKVYDGKSITYKLDTEAPKFENVKTDIKMSVKLKLSDMVSGLASYSYKWDNNEEVKVSVNENKHEVFIILKGAFGDHTLSIKVTDMAGNVFNDSNISLNIGEINEGGGNGGGSTPDIPDNEDDSGKDEPAPGPDEKPDDGGNPPVANEAIQAPALGISVENGKLCLEASQPCRVSINNYQGGTVMIRQIPSGKTRLYELPAGQYIVRLSAPYLPQGKLVRKVMVW